MRILFQWGVGDKLKGTLRGVCPYCQAEREFERYALRYAVYFIPLPSGECLRCPTCDRAVRKEPFLLRAVSVLVLVPFVGFFALNEAWLVYYWIQSLRLWKQEWLWILFGTGLISFIGYLLFRLLRFSWRMLAKKEFVPFANLQTRI